LAWLGWLGWALYQLTPDARDLMEDACFGLALAECLIALRPAMLQDGNDAIDERHVGILRREETTIPCTLAAASDCDGRWLSRLSTKAWMQQKPKWLQQKLKLSNNG
jgi:hypothetical protein